MVAGAISLLIYFPMRLSARDAVQKRQETKMEETTKPASASTTQTQTKPAETPKPPTFDTVKRDAGDVLRRK
jgi:hypothetical protein